MNILHTKQVVRSDARPANLVRWAFRRGEQTITCDVRVMDSGGRSWAVCLVPQWDAALATVEKFDNVASALRRHARISLLLCQEGWKPVQNYIRLTNRAA